MSLRQACLGAGAAAGALDVRWPHLSETARMIATTWADRPVRTPPTFQLDDIVNSVRNEWQERRSLDGVSAREMRWLPYAIFHPEANREVWLARDSAFMGAALGRVREHARGVRSLLRNVLRLWPKELPIAAQIQRVLKEELKAATSPRLREWQRRVEKYGLLSVEGPRNFANLLSAEPGRRTQVLEDAGLAGDLAYSAFLAEVDELLADRLKAHLLAQRYEELDSSLELLAPSGRLTFQNQAPIVADALLLPFVQAEPPSKVQGTIQAFLLTHLKDPRLIQSGWARVTPAAKDVMLRWMVTASLEDFFALIARRAQEGHWRYRKAFWSAYLKRKYIADAWVILGENAELEARQRWREAVPAHGQLRGGDPDHCVLILRIGNVVVTEWSHNGTCRLWLQDADACPRFHAGKYSRDELRLNPGYQQRHHGNMQYTWQQNLASVIRNTTGIGITQAEYRVR